MYYRSTVSMKSSSARPLLAGAPLERQTTVRTCTHQDCHTRLSRYNPSPMCGEHAGWQDAPARRTRASSSRTVQTEEG